MTTWEKVWTIAIFPVMLLLGIIEPLWNELRRIHQRGNLYADFAENYHTIKQTYVSDIWQKPVEK